MAIFVVILPSAEPALAAAIRAAYPEDHFSINDTQWLISDKTTATEVTAKLGIFDPKEPKKAATGSAIVFATTSYFGRAPTPVWDWIKAKLESVSG